MEYPARVRGSLALRTRYEQTGCGGVPCPDAGQPVSSFGPGSRRTGLRGGVGQAEQPRRGRTEGTATRRRPVHRVERLAERSGRNRLRSVRVPDRRWRRLADVSPLRHSGEEPVATIDAMRPMLEALLADRFQLKVHREMREMPVYALVVAGDDQRRAKITPSTTDCPKAADDLAMGRAGPGAVAALLQAGRGLPCAIMPVPPPLLPAPVADSMTVRANGATMEDLARFLTPHTGRAVQDRTALSGRYDWEMTFGVVGGVTVALAARPGITRPLITPPTP